MAEGTSSKYVRLKKEQLALDQEITPGELNQSVENPERIIHRCGECGQALPERYEPPADENWTIGICSCAEDPESCWTGLFCPCILFARNVEELRDDVSYNNACICHALCVEGGMAIAAATLLFPAGLLEPQTSFLIYESLFFAWWLCGVYSGLYRQSLQRKYHLKDSPCDPCLVHCCMHWCALCQEHREMKNHLAETVEMQTTVVDPPSVQEMNSEVSEKREPVANSGNNGQVTLELQPVENP